MLFPSPFTDKCSNNSNGPGERGDQPVINIGAQHDLNAVFDATEQVRVLNDKSSTCYIAFEGAFSLNVINGSFQVLLVNVLTHEEEVLLSALTDMYHVMST